jgi:hypothetical protein
MAWRRNEEPAGVTAAVAATTGPPVEVSVPRVAATARSAVATRAASPTA